VTFHDTMLFVNMIHVLWFCIASVCYYVAYVAVWHISLKRIDKILTKLP